MRQNNFSFELQNQPVSVLQHSKQKTKRTLHKKFYYVIAAGPTFNAVKEQSAGTGWNLGVIGGYDLNDRLSLETGIIFSQKKYWTSGDYFSTSKVGASMPPPIKIMEVDGSSKAIEIPLHLRYNVLQNRKRTIFSSAGFSSYVLTKEYNEYHTSTNGNMQMMYGTYKNIEKYLAASLDISIGYERSLSRNSSVRFQPYIQIPVQGIGMGDLKIMSTGLRIAFTKRAN